MQYVRAVYVLPCSMYSFWGVPITIPMLPMPIKHKNRLPVMAAARVITAKWESRQRTHTFHKRRPFLASLSDDDVWLLV